ncbi:MAG: triose-phosphate isomerase [Melioribacteraceae bacterium]|nr:triose-phosphate isomerase [Melioribacteraceae bacterium]MCO6474066.1 triose-phosphate isomerase [Melioribacteraceae bacterium]MDD3557081.1 triose-phosphate isomerase [Melioribacteraceae bacterium]
MRRKVIAGNWKMNNDLSGSISLISAIKNGLSEKGTDNLVIIAPPYTSLETACALIKDTEIKLSAQNMHFEESGAFTGEISAGMLKSAGCEYVILGHSERRTIFSETDEIINKKLKKALSSELLPIFCIGETLEERESGKTNSIVERQISSGLDGISESDFNKIIIAYEPVWAIGTGKTATPDQAQEVHKFIRNLIEKIYSKNSAEKCIILYGGSVKPDNSAELLSQNDIDGALVGGACLKSYSFLEIIYSV